MCISRRIGVWFLEGVLVRLWSARGIRICMRLRKYVCLCAIVWGCVFVSVYNIYIYIYIYMHTYVYMYVRSIVRVLVRLWSARGIRICMRLRQYVCLCAIVWGVCIYYMYIYIYIYIYTYVYMYVKSLVRVLVRLRSAYTYIYIHIYNIRIHIQGYAYLWDCGSMCVYMCVYTCIYVDRSSASTTVERSRDTHMHETAAVCVFVWFCAIVWLCDCVYVRVCVCVERERERF
jgi:hypothetical protein